MKNIMKPLFIIVTVMILSMGVTVSAHTTNRQKIIVNIMEANQEYIEIILVNKGKEDFYYFRGFTLKELIGEKKEKGYKHGAKFPKTSILKTNSAKIITIKWKDYYGKNLPEGKYKIKLVKEMQFIINDANFIKRKSLLKKFFPFNIIYSWFRCDDLSYDRKYLS